MAKKGPIDLSIVNRSTASTYWVTANGVITPDSLADVMEQSSDNASALNSLPTPLARYFVAREAFRRVAEAKSSNDANPNKTKKAKAGFAYEQLVSDCLDIYELLFNLKYHRNIWGGKEDIEIREWNAKEELHNLSKTMTKLYNTLDNYYKTDIAEEVLYFVIYKNGRQEYLLGSSSPFTGWVTPPDLDKTLVGKNREIVFGAEHYNNVRIKRKSGNGFYFDGKLLFEDRDEDFQNYMYNVLFASGNIDNRLANISSYIKSFEYGSKISSNFAFNLTDNISTNNNVIIVNGIEMKQNDEIDVNSFFQSSLLRVPYRLSSSEFQGISYEREVRERNYDFLLPLNSEGLSLIEKGATCVCQVRNSDIIVKLTYNGKDYLKTYEDNPTDLNKGRIISLNRERKYFNLALFPNILSSQAQENNYFKVALYEQDSNDDFTTLSIDKCSLKFFRKDRSGTYEEIEEIDKNGNATNGTYTPVVRSRQSRNCPVGSKYYELFNTPFDAIEVNIEGACGMVLPVWRYAKQTNESYTYAVDLGTSNTFISRTMNGQNYAPVQLEMLEPMTSFLHDYKDGNQYSKAFYIEEALPENIRTSAVTEFAPTLIDGKYYDFPIRTALCHDKATADEASLFDNTNIAFFYEKALKSDSQEILTDIKWLDNKNNLCVFIKEIMLIIKADILQHNGVLSQTNLVRFRPLSFDGKIKRMYDEIWNTIPEEVFGVKPKKVDCFTESEAPYYYFTKRNIVKNTDSVSVIDIGGGSTDFVYFKENKPLIASSVHFGCDELWSDGHIEYRDTRENGIYKKYYQSLMFKDNNIAGINSAMIVDAKVSAKNIINFWLTNQKFCGIKDSLRNDYAPLFVYHFVALIYYMASMYKFKELDVPRTIVFSGNGSRYIDNFITEDISVIQEVIKVIFDKVYGVVCPDIYVTLPEERKESTCYGGLYKDPSVENVPEVTFHGVDKIYTTAKELIDDKQLLASLMMKYKEMNSLYVSILSLLKNRGVIDRSLDVTPFTNVIDNDYDNNFTTHFRSKVAEKYKSEDDICNDAVFFIPVIDKLFELTKVI